MFAGKAGLLWWSTFKVLSTRVGSWPYPETKHKAEKVCHEQTIYLILANL
jgi:hypothetical protein